MKLYQELKIKEGDVIVFGCSYGPDSMALFKSLLLLREEIPVKLVCAHVNHGKRKESEEEKIDLESFCFENDVVFEYMKIEHYGDDNFHNEARNIRYEFFDKIVKKYQAKYLMLAHHGDDLIETILMRIVRGSNLSGYSGFKKKVEKDDYILYRPFISYTKEELLDFNQKYHVPYAIDKSNQEMIYTRNRYRKKILPFLKEEDQKVHEKFLKFSKRLDEVSQYIEKESKKVLTKVYNHDRVYIDKFLEQDDFMQRYLLEEILKEFYQDDLILIGDKHINLLRSIMKSKKANTKVDLPNNVVAYKAYNTLTIVRNPDAIDCYEIELNDYIKLPNNHVLRMVEEESGNSNHMIRLSSKELLLPLRVRTRKYGDIMAIKGGGRKKVKDIFIDKKIPLKDRDLWPVVVDSKDTIVFLPGLKKSKFDKKKDEFYDIILKYE